MANTYKGYGLTPQGNAVPYSGGSAPASVLEAENAQKLGGVPAGDYALKTEVAANKAELEALKSGVEIVKTENGSAIAVNDAAERTLRGMTIYGKTEQKRYSGKNLINISDYKSPYPTAIVTYNKDGSVTMSMNASEGHISGLAKNLAGLIPAGTYTFTNYGDNTAYIMFNDSDWSSPLRTDQSITFTYDGASYLNLTHVNIQAGQTKTHRVQLELGSTATSYEPYVGGIPSPNPDYPQELKTAGSDGEIFVTADYNMINSSLLRSNDVIQVEQITNGVKLTALVSTWYTCYEISAPFLESNKTYTLSADVVAHDENPKCRRYLCAMMPDNTYVEKAIQADGHISITFNAKAPVTLRFGVNNEGTFKSVSYTNIVLCEGETEKPYVPQTNVVHISTPNGLPGIPVTSGGNYTDESGQQWICDEVDLERGVYVKRVKPFNLSEVSVWRAWGEHWYNHGYLKDSAATWNAIIGTCSHVRSSGIINNDLLLHSDVANDQFYGIQINNAKTYWGFTGSTAEEFKAFIDSKNVKIVYACAPAEIPLTAEELAAYRALHTCYPNTTFYNDAGADMNVRYVADTKLYLDNKIAEINEQNMAMSAALLGL